MKRLTFLLLLGVTSAFAVPSFEPARDFSASGGSQYGIGANLVGQTNSTLTGAWYIRGDANAGAQPVIVAGNLSHTNLPHATGNSIAVVPSAGKTACLDLGLPSTHTETVYYSFLLKVTDLAAVSTTAAENPIAMFIDDPSTAIPNNTIARRGARLLTKRIGSSNFVLGTGKSSSTADFVYEPDGAAHAIGQVLFVVASHQRIGNTTNLNLWVNPSSDSFGTSTPPAPTLVAPVASVTTGGLNNNNARGFAITCQFTNAPSAIIDEVRISTNWAYVTGGDPAILQNPTDLTLPEGANAVFTTAARGTPTLTYQWVKNEVGALVDGGNVSGANTAALTISGISASDVGTYSVVISNGPGASVTSSGATLALADPAITSQPQSRTNNFGTTATFSVSASGTGPFSYQWVKEGTGDLTNGGNISGSQSATLTISGVAFSDGGNYSVRVTGGLGVATSANATLTVRDPYIVTQPADVAAAAGSTVNFSVVANGSGQPFNYQWRRNGNLIFDLGNYSGTSTATLTVSNISPAEEGTYSVLVIGPNDTATSANAALTVLTPVSIAAQPVPRTVTAGSKAMFSVGVTGSGPLAYQWLFNGSSLSDGTSAAYAVTDAQVVNEGGYSVIVTGPLNSVTSSVVALTIAANAHLSYTNVVVLRVGDGAQTLSANGNSMSLDQFSANGSYINSLNIPDNGSNAMITMGPNSVPSPSSVTGTTMSRSADGRYLVISGYNTPVPYGAALNTTTAAAVPRGVGLFDGSGGYTLGLSSTDATFNSTFWRSAVTDGTNNYWGAARSPGTYYFGFDAASALVQNTFANIRSMGLFNGNIYCVSAVAANSGVMKLDGMPTNASAPTTILFPGTTGFSDIEVSPNGNVIYVADDRSGANGGGVQRWEYNGTWVLMYTLTNGVSNGVRYVAADFSGANPVVYAVSKEVTEDNNRLVIFHDTGVESVGTTVAYAGANQNFRGLRLGPTGVAAAPLITLSRVGNNITLTWDGGYKLHSSTNVAGPYLEIPGASSPYPINASSTAREFFRLQQ